MTPVPPNQKIYHITHVDNLSAIIAAGELRSDALLLAQGGAVATVGMGKIKARRLGLPVKCLDGVMVGDCVPFYFGPRSVMLYLIHMRNPELTYRGGQEPILHLEADLREVMRWTIAEGRPWAFSRANAAAIYTEFCADLQQFKQLDWAAVRADDWRDAGVKERKQAEFLVKDTFPWELFSVIGANSTALVERVEAVLAQGKGDGSGNQIHRPVVEYRPTWYY